MSNLNYNRYNISAPVEFLVASFTPVEFPAGKEEHTLHISGGNLGRVNRILFKHPISGEIIGEFDIPDKQRYNGQLQVQVPAEMPDNTMFFAILEGRNDSWYPVGPLIKLLK